MLAPVHNAPEPGPLGLGSGAFSRSLSKIIGQKKGVSRTGAAPFLLVACKMATYNTRINRLRVKRVKHVSDLDQVWAPLCSAAP